MKKMTKRLLFFLLLISGSLILGTSYAAWNAQLKVSAKLSTGSMNILFEDDACNKRCSVEVMKGDEVIKDLGADVNLKEKEKKAEIKFVDGLPIHLLCEGHQIRVKFELKPDEESLGLVEEQEKDLQKAPEKLIIEAKEVALNANGEKIGTVQSEDLEAFKLDLEFHVERELKTDEHKITGIILLTMTDESIAKVKELPKKISLDKAKIHGSQEAAACDQVKYELAVEYDCELDFLVHQKELSPAVYKEGEN